MSQEVLDRLVANRVLERIAADPETASAELEQARLHVESAAEIADRDPVGAFAIGYDAIRKALCGHMRHRGYRVGKGKGHHPRTGRYAMAALDSVAVEEHVDAFDELRQLRNQSEYDALVVDANESRTPWLGQRRSSPRLRRISVPETRADPVPLPQQAARG